jgi:diguanylate cyclase (GGDEF)-like protein/hemerythrin-like metal-binding protein
MSDTASQGRANLSGRKSLIAPAICGQRRVTFSQQLKTKTTASRKAVARKISMSANDHPGSAELQAPHLFEVFPWNDNFNTGNPVIDEQHQKLVALLNNLANTLVNNHPLEVEFAFSELAKYADYHFAAEEEIWGRYLEGDEWFHVHQQSHGDFLPQVLEIRDRDSGRPLDQIIAETVKFLIRWLAFHIINDDKRYAMVVAEMAEGKTIEEAKLNSHTKMSASSVRVLIDTVLAMYDSMSTQALNLLREQRARMQAESRLKQAYLELETANRRLEELSITDQLTKLHNRRHFDFILEKELSRARRESSTLTLILLDIDHFKMLNDSYGHPVGDVALIKVGSKLQEICRRSGDYVFRIGGEEFAVLACGEIKNNSVEGFAEIIRREIAALKIPNGIDDRVESLTVSLGVVSKVPDSSDTGDVFLREADRRLYAAKEGGRNRSVS